MPYVPREITSDHKKVSVTLAALKPGCIYELNLGGIKGASGKGLANKLIGYTNNNFKKVMISVLVNRLLL